MTFKITGFILASVSIVAMTGCHARQKMEDAQYWGRKNATSALYLRGPKAQQTLHQDIATCVNEISELERLAPVREAIPADTDNGRVPDANSAEGRLKRWDTPKRDGYLYSEHSNYSDFEGCMDYKGWERVEALPHTQAEQSRKEYLDTVYGNQFQSDYGINKRQEEQPANAYKSSPDAAVNN